MSIGIVKASYGAYDGIDGGDLGHIDVTFKDSRRPEFEVVVTVERVFVGSTGSQSSPWRTRCIGMSFRPETGTSPFGESELRTSWIKGFPVERILGEAREAARQFETDAEVAPGPRLPVGAPHRINRRDWYAALLRYVDHQVGNEQSPMDVYRLIADRKNTSPNNVKQWVFQARKLQEEDS